MTDVPAWLAREQVSALAIVDAAEGRRALAAADHERRLAQIARDVAFADKTLRALAKLAAKRGAQ